MIKNKKIGFIGCGNMGKALIGGLIKSEALPPENIIAFDKDEKKLNELKNFYKITTSNAPDVVAQDSSILIIAVKPAQVEQLINKIKENDKARGKDSFKNTILISIAAGVSVNKLENMAGSGVKVIRVMPNTPAMVLEGASALVRGNAINDEDMNVALEIFKCVGLALELPEEKIDAVTGVSGSSPAFIFQIIEAMSDAGVMAGLDRKTAISLSAQAVLGSAKMVLEAGMHPAELKDMVTSPSGTTIEGVFEMEKHGARAAIISAISAAVTKSKEMNKK